MILKLIKLFFLLKKRIENRFWYLYNKNEVAYYKDKFYIGGKTILSKNTYIGSNVSFNGLVINGKGKVIIGDNFHSGAGCLFITDAHNYNGEKIPYDEKDIIKDIVIEDNVWIGSNVIILGGVTIGEGAIIQEGSVVVNNVGNCMIVGGPPAKPFSSRNEKKYNKLKKLGSFH
ncbi:acyltransferase [Vibrio alginolyticus]|nr:acyltransferase [Vibrio alginolyticus]